MAGFRLARTHGAQTADLWSLPTDRAVIVGRSDPERGTPDVDLWPDARVSRQQARIWFEREAWWIEDASSKHGTLVGGEQLRGQGPRRVEPGEEIEIGDTGLMLVRPHWRRVRGQGLVVDFELTPALNLAV